MSQKEAFPVLYIANPVSLPLDSQEILVLQCMFASYSRITIQSELGGGLSGSRILLIHPVKSELSPDLPLVVKIAPRHLIEQEWQAYLDHVYQKLAGIAELAGPPAHPPDATLSGLRYALTGQGGAFEVISLRHYARQAGANDLQYVLTQRLFRIMGPNWWQFNRVQPDWPLQAIYDHVLPVNLWIEPAQGPTSAPYILTPDPVSWQACPSAGWVRLEGFIVVEINPGERTVTLNVPPRADGLLSCFRLRVQHISSPQASQVGQPMPPIEGCIVQTRAGQLCAWIQEVVGEPAERAAAAALPNPLPVALALLRKTRHVKTARIHGDLNLENILVEPAGRNVSLIDFATARCDYVLHDLLRLETEVITHLLSEALADGQMLGETIAAWFQQLHQATFAGERLSPFEPPAGLERPFAMLVSVRQMARQFLFDFQDWSEYYDGLILYLLGTLKFKNLSSHAKQVAFWAAAAICAILSPGEAQRTPAALDWSRLRPYLPAALYTSHDEHACLLHQSTLLRVLLTYLPRRLALDLLRRPWGNPHQGRFLEGTLLLADISDFTAMSDRLRALGEKQGAEEMTRLINRYLDVMLGILLRRGGQLIKFGGDSMLCLFTGPDQGAPNAMVAAWEMQEAVAKHFAQIQIWQEIFPLRIKSGSSSGLLFEATIGDAEHMEYILAGSAAEHVARAEAAAHQGDILISQETLALLQGRVQVEPLANAPGLCRVLEISSNDWPAAEQDPWHDIEQFLAIIEHDLGTIVERLEAVSPYLPAGLLPQLVYALPDGLQTSHMEGQHRQITVLFANLMGLNQVISAHGTDDPAGIAADLQAYLLAMQDEVQYYGGVIDKMDLYDQGDKLMILFGAPQAHERDVQRAALTALAMQQAMNRLCFPTATLLSQRIGIHTGFAFAGNVGSSIYKRREYTVMGSTVNLAARLGAAAQPGDIWISSDVWTHIETGFRAQKLAPIQAHGIVEPVTPYRLEAARHVPEGRMGSRSLYSPLIGRERELSDLQTCLAAVLSGAGKRIVAVIGEVGVGKTRLIAEWRQQAAATAATWAGGYGHSYGQKAFGVWIEILESLLGLTGEDDEVIRWRKLSALVQKHFAHARSGWLDAFSGQLACLGAFLNLDLSRRRELAERAACMSSETLYLHTRAAICDLLTQCALERPLALVLEDMHWADEASLELLQFIVEHVPDHVPILFCLILRPLHDHRVWNTWQTIERICPDCQRIDLPELPASDGHRLLHSLLHNDQLPADFQSQVIAATDGNPLYIEEVLHAWIETGIVVQEGEIWQLRRHVAHIPVPDTLYQIIQSRIDELDFGSPGARRVLWMAAVLGEMCAETPLRRLFASAGRDPNELAQHLRELRNAAMLKQVQFELKGRSEWGYAFQHGLVRQVAYENMPIERRRAYHLETARWLQAQHTQELSLYYDALAEHYDHAQVWDQAFLYHHLAGQQDARRYANQSAAAHLTRALELAGRIASGAAVRGQVSLELGQTLVVMGEFERALAQLAQAHDLFASEPQAMLLQARVCYEMGRVYERMGGGENFQSAQEWAGRGLVLLPPTPTAEAALLHLLSAAVATRQADFARVEQESTCALALAQAVQAQAEIGLAHRLLSFVARAHGQLDRAMAHCQDSLVICRERGDWIGLAKDYANRGIYALEMGDWPLAETTYLEALTIQERIGDRYQAALTRCNLGDLYCHLGDVARGIEYTIEGLRTFEILASPQGIIFAHTVLGTLHWRGGDLTGAQAELLQARQLIETHQSPEFSASVGRWLAQIYLAQGRLAEAEVEIEWLRGLDADELGMEAEPVQRIWGQILAARGQTEQAVETLQASIVRLQEMGERYEEGRTHLALAGVWTVAGQQDRAREQAKQALAICSELGARLDAQEAQALLNGEG